MALTEITYTGDGSDVTFGPIPFDYLEDTDVKVSLDGVVTTAFTIDPSTKIITFSSAPGNGVSIRVFRRTDFEDLSATFISGSAIRAQDLNDNFNQNLYVTQEISNYAITNDGLVAMEGDLDMGGYKITNLAEPTADSNAATKQYIDTRLGSLDVPGFTRWSKTAVGGETTLSGAGTTGGTLGYSPNREQVYLNGAQLQRDADYTANNGTSIVLNVVLTAGDVVEVICVNNLNTGTTAQAQDVYWNQSGSGAVTRTVESKLQDVVSVKDFGAKGDGVTDDTAAIQAAIATGRSIYFPQTLDFYLVSGRIDLTTPGQVLFGNSPQSTEIKLVKPPGSNGHPLFWFKPAAIGAGINGLHINHNAQDYIEPANWATASGDPIIWNSGVVLGANDSFIINSWVSNGHNCGVAVTSAADDVNYQSTTGLPKRAIIDNLTTFTCGVGYRSIDSSRGGPGWNVGSGSQARVSNCVDWQSYHGGMVDINAGAQAVVTNCVAWYNKADPTTRKGGLGFYFAADGCIASNLRVYNPERIGVWVDKNAKRGVFSNIVVQAAGHNNSIDPADVKAIYIKADEATTLANASVINSVSGDGVVIETPGTNGITGLSIDNLTVDSTSHAYAVKCVQTGGFINEGTITNAALTPGTSGTVLLDGKVSCQYREIGASTVTLDPGHSVVVSSDLASTAIEGFTSSVSFDGSATAFTSLKLFNVPNVSRSTATGDIYGYYVNLPREADTWGLYVASRCYNYIKGSFLIAATNAESDVTTGAANGKSFAVDNYVERSSRNTTTTQAHHEFYNPNGKVGQIRTLDSATQYHINGGGGVYVTGGSGSPESVITASPGSIYLRTDGGAGTSLYVKESGTGNTGWVAK